MEFEEFVKRLEDMEKNVDRVLKAARLERKERTPMPQERLAMILNYAVGTFSLFLGFIIVLLIIYYFNH